MVGSVNLHFANSDLGLTVIIRLVRLVPNEYSLISVIPRYSYISSITLGVAVAVTASKGILGNCFLRILSF